MSDPAPSTTSTPSRGRGKSRGGLGKYLRAKGRRGGGRPAEFGKRLVLEGEGHEEIDPDDEEAQEAAREEAKRYSRRQLGTNADRYKEEEPELGSDGEPIVEPEVDLSAFLAKQRLQDDASPGPSSMPPPEYDAPDDVDHTLSHIRSAQSRTAGAEKKGRAQQIGWDHSLEEMRRDKDAADAQRDLRDRFRSGAANRLSKPSNPSTRSKQGSTLTEAPPLPSEGPTLPKKPKDEMEDFLDDLLG